MMVSFGRRSRLKAAAIIGGMCHAGQLLALPPSHDQCSNCTPLRSDEPVQGTTVGATGTDITSCGSGDTADVWYCWRASCTGTASVDLCANFNATAAAFDACGGTQLGCRVVGICDPKARRLTFRVDEGSDYLIRISGAAGQMGGFGLSIACENGCGPSETLETEPDCGFPTDTVNGGCSSEPPVFSSVSCGQHICGTIGSDDEDWYSITVASPTRFIWSAQPDFHANIGLVEMQIPGLGECFAMTGYVTPYALVAPQENGSVAVCLPAGEHWFYVASAQVFAQCGTLYRASLECGPLFVGGDLNCDGTILDDWRAWLLNDCLRGPDQAVSARCKAYDLDGDGDVDLHDAAFLGLMQGE